MGLTDLLFLSDQRGRPCPKPATRLQETVAQRPLTKVDERTFKTEVWTRDKGHCRCCLRKVVKTIARVPERGEVHHIHGRTGDLRFEAKAALLSCATCHEKLTGRVNAHRLVIIPSQTFVMRDQFYTDARFLVTFRELA